MRETRSNCQVCRKSGTKFHVSFSGLLLAVKQEKLPPMNKLFPYPYFVLLSIIAFNITAFTVVLQLDMLIIDSIAAKVISWIVTVAAWTVVYIFRNK